MAQPLVPLLLTPARAGELLGVSADTVRRLVAAGELPGCYQRLTTAREVLRIHRRHVEAYAAALAAEAEHAAGDAWRWGGGRAIAAGSKRRKTR